MEVNMADLGTNLISDEENVDVEVNIEADDTTEIVETDNVISNEDGTETDVSYDLDKLSDGVVYITKGYMDYTQEVVTSRALADLRDGLKPVNRRIMYSIFEGKYKHYAKCATLVGKTMEYHPHGDASIYDALVLMTDENGSLAFPLIDGSGSFGGVFKTDAPAASRYTEAKLHSNADEYFGDMQGIKMLPNFDSTKMEPEVLPVTFPAVLVNSTSGIAVGFKSNMPSFNFIDVCNLVKEYIRDGECTTVIMPDFVTGGYYVKNDKELQRLMKTGRGKIKLRGRSEIVGKEINVLELPYGKTIQGLLHQINAKDLPSIRNAYDTDDFDHDMMFTIECKSKSVVQEALMALYRYTDFQYVYNADMTLVHNGMPKRFGVWSIIENWVAWRREVILKEQKYRLEALKENSEKSRAFMEVIKYSELKEQLVSIIVKEGKDAGVKFVLEHFDNEVISNANAEWICRRRLADFHNGGEYKAQYENALKEIEHCKSIIGNTDAEISRQMDELIVKYGSKMQRRTEVTDQDFDFSGKAHRTQKKDTSSCYFDYKNGFLRKLKSESDSADKQFSFKGNNSSTLIAFDNMGRLLRVYANELPMNSVSDMGAYLPRYFGITETQDWKITWIGEMKGQTLLLIYTDGTIGFVETSEWVANNRRVKVLEKGISAEGAQKLAAVVDFTSIGNIQDKILLLTDTKRRICWTYMRDFKHKGRTARTRIFPDKTKSDVYYDSYCITDEETLKTMFVDTEKFYGSPKKVKPNEFLGRASSFTLFK